MIKRFFAAALLAAVAMSNAWAQPYPVRPVTFIYPYAAGSVLDVAWRRILEEASKHLGQPIVLDNRAGAGGRTGFSTVMNARPDGYTIGQGSNALSVIQPLIDPARFNIVAGEHYTPIALAMDINLVLVARPSAPFKTFAQLVAAAKANPGKLNAGSSGPGTATHLGLALLNRMAGIDIMHVPYKGNAPALQALMSGDIDVMFTDAAALPFVQSGRLIPLAVGTEERWAIFPAVPTIAESGYPKFSNSSWTGIVGPKGLPPEIAGKLNAAFNAALNTPALRTRLEADGWTILGGNADAVVKRIKIDTDTYRPIIRDANITME